ncbi:CKLF-like MARVEL transmembrane domain-containing protein 4 [Patiria miniata]|uniref:MARVEL domain-containing protein n=1 Tax=Patiria miniata TaxID=46514 RepID=A0A914B168_PATMI|nr:CKLF-like MARVEL transmembrane domain-containing protein 4 [Patiria miniata]
MAELNQHDVESSKAQPSGAGRKSACCGMDMDYVRSINGILKGNQIGWTCLAFIMSWFCGLAALSILFAIAMCFGLVLTIVIFVAFAFSLKSKKIDFYLADFLVSIVATVVYFALSLPMLILSGGAPLFILAGIFGFLALAGFFVNILFSFKRWRSSGTRAASDNQPYDTNQ